MIEIHI